MKITTAAIEYLTEASKSLKDPVLAIFERSFQTCCSVKKVTQIILVARADIPDDGTFRLVELSGWNVFLDKKLNAYENTISIDFTGSANIRRLFITGIPAEPQNSGCC